MWSRSIARLETASTMSSVLKISRSILTTSAMLQTCSFSSLRRRQRWEAPSVKSSLRISSPPLFFIESLRLAWGLWELTRFAYFMATVLRSSEMPTLKQQRSKPFQHVRGWELCLLSSRLMKVWLEHSTCQTIGNRLRSSVMRIMTFMRTSSLTTTPTFSRTQGRPLGWELRDSIRRLLSTQWRTRSTTTRSSLQPWLSWN